MTGRVDEVEDVFLPVGGDVVHPRGLGLDRDPSFTLEVHVVEVLRLLVALRDHLRLVEQTIGQRALAVVDVRDDAEVANARLVDAHRVSSRAVSSNEPPAYSGAAPPPETPEGAARSWEQSEP